MTKPLSECRFLVLGAGGGIGSELCRQLREAGAGVILAGRDEAKLSALADGLDSPHLLLKSASVESIEECLSGVRPGFGHVDGIVNCIGSLLLKPAHLTKPAEWEETLAVNLGSAFAAVRAAHKLMDKSGGSVVLMSSAAARIGLPNHEAIAAAKAGVIGLMRSAAASYAARNIRVNAVAPGLVKTGMTERIWSSEKASKVSRGMHALGRLGEPADVASLIAWLLRPDNSWITGQVFGTDGGLATLRA